MSIKQYNFFVFIVYIVFSELLLFFASRLLISNFNRAYFIAEIEVINVIYLITICILVVVYAFLLSFFFGRIRSSNLKINFPLILGILFFLSWLAFIIFVDRKARYQSGGLTGFSGLVNLIFFVFSNILLLYILQNRICGVKQKYHWLVLIAYAITIDGLAKTFTIFLLFVTFIYNKKYQNYILFIIPFFAVIFIYIGINVKWQNGIPDYVNPHFFYQWGISRFSIHVEQAYRYISGEGLTGSFYSVWELYGNSIDNRITVLNGFGDIVYPRSLSEAVSFDGLGEYGSGSSPGFISMIILHGASSVIILPIIFAIIFSYFLKINVKLNLIHFIVIGFLLRSIYVDWSWLFTIFTPTTIFVLFYILVVPIWYSSHVK